MLTNLRGYMSLECLTHYPRTSFNIKRENFTQNTNKNPWNAFFIQSEIQFTNKFIFQILTNV